MRFAAGVEYCGSQYSGWQKQNHTQSVQSLVESALSTVADHSIEVTCAGRTDAGVHATCQVIHFDSDAVRQEHSWVFGCNSNLPPDVSIAWVKPVVDDFHARFSALSRTYVYLIINRAARPALAHCYMTWECRALDADRMQDAANYLLGKHDFTSFRATGCQAKSPVRTVHSLDVVRSGEIIRITIEANAFLHHMVRNIAGVLISVGTGRADSAWVAGVLAARNREYAGVTAPADGLYLAAISYPPSYGLPEAGNYAKRLLGLWAGAGN